MRLEALIDALGRQLIRAIPGDRRTARLRKHAAECTVAAVTEVHAIGQRTCVGGEVGYASGIIQTAGARRQGRRAIGRDAVYVVTGVITARRQACVGRQVFQTVAARQAARPSRQLSTFDVGASHAVALEGAAGCFAFRDRHCIDAIAFGHAARTQHNWALGRNATRAGILGIVALSHTLGGPKIADTLTGHEVTAGGGFLTAIRTIAAVAQVSAPGSRAVFLGRILGA